MDVCVDVVCKDETWTGMRGRAGQPSFPFSLFGVSPSAADMANGRVALIAVAAVHNRGRGRSEGGAGAVSVGRSEATKQKTFARCAMDSGTGAFTPCVPRTPTPLVDHAIGASITSQNG